MAPSRLFRRTEQWARDARMIARMLTGRRPSPLLSRKASRWFAERPSESLGVRPLRARVEQVEHPTPTTALVRLARDDGEAFDVAAGQFFTWALDVGGVRQRRAYSVALAPGDALRSPNVRFLVKEVPGGVVSHHITRELRVGDVVELLGPAGSFVLPEDPAVKRLVLIAGGSGIAPIVSLAREARRSRPGMPIDIVYGNRRRADVPLAGELRDLAAASDGAVSLRFALDIVDEPDRSSDWIEGALTRDVVLRALSDAARSSFAGGGAHAYVCGPEPMMREARLALESLGAGAAQIHIESFTLGTRSASAEPARDVPVVFVHKGKRVSAVQRGEASLLETGLEAGVEMRFSCTLGGCGACRVRLVEGEVDMPEPNALTADERDKGYVLACVARACSKVTVEVDP